MNFTRNHQKWDGTLKILINISFVEVLKNKKLKIEFLIKLLLLVSGNLKKKMKDENADDPIGDIICPEKLSLEDRVVGCMLCGMIAGFKLNLMV